jgi:hypothetical protein
MKAIVISPATQSIEMADVTTRDDIRAIVGYDTLESDAIGSTSMKSASCAAPPDGSRSTASFPWPARA